MIPLQVTLEGFLSYEKKQIINFVGASIWALSGPNSVGKSAVFDAMTFALYHRARCGPKDLIHHRADRLIVTFDFMVDDTIYRIKRIHPRKGRSTREALLRGVRWDDARKIQAWLCTQRTERSSALLPIVHVPLSNYKLWRGIPHAHASRTPYRYFVDCGLFLKPEQP